MSSVVVSSRGDTNTSKFNELLLKIPPLENIVAQSSRIVIAGTFEDISFLFFLIFDKMPPHSSAL